MRLICMSFDGEYVTEQTGFKTTDEAWERADCMGSRWYFYPFCFVTTETGKTIVDAPDYLKGFEGRRVSTVKQIFAAFSKHPEVQGMDVDTFAFCVPFRMPSNTAILEETHRQD